MTIWTVDRQLRDEIVEIAESEGALWISMDSYPVLYFSQKGVMYTPNVEESLTVTSVAMMVDKGIQSGSGEFAWAYEGFKYEIESIEFRPAKLLKHWPKDK